MPENTPNPREKALAWWKERVDADRYVVPSSESPSAAVAKVLRSERLVLDVANKRIWILTEPSRTDERGIFLRNYWRVVEELLDGWAPAGVSGVEAVRLHLGEAAPPLLLPVLHGANQSRYKIALFDEFEIALKPGEVADSSISRVTANGAKVPVLAPAHLLATLDRRELDLGLEPVSAWLRHLVIRTPELQEAVAMRPRAYVVGRLAELARNLGNTQLADQLEKEIQATTERPPAPSQTGVGSEIAVPAALAHAARGTGSPWLDRQLMTLERFRAELDGVLGPRVGPPPGLRIAALVGNARQAKQYDAYHNTTIEGYKISREVSDAVISGAPLPGFKNEEELRAVMAVQGYSLAFDLVIDAAGRASPPPIDEGFILDLYTALFRPSVDAGIVTEADLRGWRTINVGLAGGWRHSPPGPNKVPSLIRGMSEYLARPDLQPLTHAVLAHLEFVTIHPFIDGNGRLARLLMNYALLTSGYPWVTIRSDERFPYFKALESAQADEDVRPLAEFLAVHFAQAVAGVKPSPRARSR